MIKIEMTKRNKTILAVAITAAILLAGLLVVGGFDEKRAVRERIAINMKEDSWARYGADFLFYSDDRSSRTILLDGAAGNIDSEGTMNVAGAVMFQSTLGVTGAFSVTGALTLEDKLTLNDALLIDGDSDEQQLVIQAHSTQNTEAFLVETSAGADKFEIFATGNYSTTGTALIEGKATINDAVLIDGDGDELQLVVQGHSSQTPAIVLVETSAGADVFHIYATGNYSTTGTGLIEDKLTVNDAVLIDGDGNENQLRVEGHSSQTTATVLVETSAGADLFTISNAGNVSHTGTLRVGSTSDFQGDVANSINDLRVADDISIDGDTHISGTLNLVGDIALGVDSEIGNASDNVIVDDSLDVTANLVVTGTSSLIDQVVATGAIYANGGLYVTGALSTTADLAVGNVGTLAGMTSPYITSTTA